MDGMDMETVKFDCNGHNAPAYGCDKPGDQSGEYNRKEDVERMEILLKASYDLLKKCDEGPYVKNALEETVFYDEADCDGFCLMEDIASVLGIEDED